MNTNTENRLLIPSLLLVGGITCLLLALLTTNPTAGHAAAEATIEVTAETQSVPDAETVTAGKAVFRSVCATCHGFDALGIRGLGKPLIGSVFVNSLTDAELLAFLQTGRPVNDALNTTGVAMPARGGRPSMTDDDLVNIIAYIRSLNADG